MKKAADILHTILAKQEADRARNWSGFFRGWQVMAGEDLAAHSSVKDVKQGTVLVEVDHPGWLQMLQMKKNYILKNIKGQYPELDITDIRCFLGAGNPPMSDPTEIPHPAEQSKADENSSEYQEFKALLKRLRDG